MASQAKPVAVGWRRVLHYKSRSLAYTCAQNYLARLWADLGPNEAVSVGLLRARQRPAPSYSRPGKLEMCNAGANFRT